MRCVYETGGIIVWSCRACGPSFSSRGGWCDLGCGSDYNQMTRLHLDAFGVVLVLAHLWRLHERMRDIPWFWPPRGLKEALAGYETGGRE